MDEKKDKELDAKTNLSEGIKEIGQEEKEKTNLAENAA